MTKTIAPKKCIAFRAQADTASTRTETFQGTEYLVVPVIALVEGVLQGINAAEPELALAEEFGKFPAGWNGRPVVMNHPTVENIPVSANSPAMLESYAFGMLFNTQLDGEKLKTEAWIDVQEATNKGGEFLETLERLQTGEMVEVSTGLFTGVEQTKGLHNNEAYSGVWRGVVPDHLAILSAGKTGACSVADGCGAPRINEGKDWPEMTLTTSVNNQEPHDCSCGGEGGEKSCTCSTTPPTEDGLSFNMARYIDSLKVEEMPDGMLDKDVRQMLGVALRKELGKYSYIVGFTNSVVLYETYDDSDQYSTYQRSYSFSGGKATLADDARKVVLQSVIVPLERGNTLKTQENDSMANSKEETTQEQKTSPGKDVTTETVEATAEPSETAEATRANASQPTTAPSPTPAPSKLSVQEYLAAAPEEVREALESGLKLHKSKKDGLVKGLIETGRCRFNEDKLRSMSLDDLENLAELAKVPTYDGVASPTTHANATQDLGAPPLPKVFEKKPAA